MTQMEILKSMWSPRLKRKVELIVPMVSYEGKAGSLHNNFWAFEVGYSFRDALDIRYEERRKNKVPYMVWTQGPAINFKEGDFLHSRDGSEALQVRAAVPMEWDVEKNEMYEGSVAYVQFCVADGSYTEVGIYECSQMEFLSILIFGTEKSGIDDGTFNLAMEC